MHNIKTVKKRVYVMKLVRYELNFFNESREVGFI